MFKNKLMKDLRQIFVVLISLVLFSCGGDKKEEQEEEKITVGDYSSNSSAGTTETAAADANVTEVVIEANDQMQFSKNEIKVKAGQTVRLTLQHVGEMDENVMGHNWVLLEPDTDISQFGQAAAKAKGNEYIPQDTEQVIVHTKMLGGGESDTIEFQAPGPGTYAFICSFPGHYSLMKGVFIVE